MDAKQREVPAAPAAAAASSSSRRGHRKQRAPRSLLLLLKSLVGLRVRVDLKTDASVEGVVAEVVHDMECVSLLGLEARCVRVERSVSRSLSA